MRNIVLKDLHETTSVYIDDTVLGTRTAEDLLVQLEKSFQRLEKYHVKLKPSKCWFGYPEVKFLGHLFHKEGYRIDPERSR